jgi:hypothetical protein
LVLPKRFPRWRRKSGMGGYWNVVFARHRPSTSQPALNHQRFFVTIRE